MIMISHLIMIMIHGGLQSWASVRITVQKQ
jgi:hypothetical protein